MAAISSWLLSIAGVIILSVLAEFVLPDGQINKYTKVIFSFVVLLVIIAPLPKILNKDFDFSQFFKSEENVLQEDYLYQVNLDKLTALNQKIVAEIKDEGLNGVEVSINANVLCKELEIFGVYVDLENLKFDKKFTDKTIGGAKVKILEIIKKNQILNDVEVKFNEGS